MSAPAVGSVRYAYRCQVVTWTDGDTCRLDVDLGFDLHYLIVARIAGINTPETSGATKAAGIAAREYAQTIAPGGCFVVAQTAKPREKYGRWMASITLDNGHDFAREMIAAGHAVEYDGGSRS